jgi:peptidoglycan/xylan/chitin deacetylase (PgdA/CDA1 family)
MNSAIKRILESTLVGSGAARIARRRMAGRTLILAYHNVVPDDEPVTGDSSLHLSRARFARQLDILQEVGEVIPLPDVANPATDSSPRFAVTFDDAYLGAMTIGVDELRRRDLPATVFVAPGLLGQTTWWDAIATATGGVIPDEVRENALVRHAGRGADVLAGLGTRLPMLPRIASFNQLRLALDSSRLLVGSHTWSHVNLEAVRGVELSREVTESAAWLSTHFGDLYVPWLSYPYGRAGVEAEKIARQAGYRAAVRVDGGWMTRPLAPQLFVVPRLNISRGLSDNGFLLRVSGIAK